MWITPILESLLREYIQGDGMRKEAKPFTARGYLCQFIDYMACMKSKNL